MENESLKKALSELSIVELAELLQDVLPRTKVREKYENGDFFEQTHVVAQVSWGSIEGLIDPEPTVTFLGNCHPDVVPTDWGAEICQEGKCIKCNSLVSSHAKVAVCPVCGARVSCT